MPDTASLSLSVLDQSPISEGSNGSEALRNTLDLARLTDELGYHRYWVAEHHGGAMLASASPETLIGPIASVTSRMRIGSGGVMLPHQSPLKVAEAFSILSGLFPDRIDLGLGRAPGTDAQTMFALQRDRSQAAPDDFPQQLVELLAYLDDNFPAGHALSRLARAMPGRPGRPEPWLLGSSEQSGIWAAELGLPYCFADFISAGGGEIAQRYRQSFMPSGREQEPRVVVALRVTAAETDEEALRLGASWRMAMTMLRQGRPIEVPPVEKAIRFLESQGSPLDSQPTGRRAITGSPATVRAGIEEAAAEYGADEVMIVTITHDHAARRRSYELIADAFGLRPQPAAASPAGA